MYINLIPLSIVNVFLGSGRCSEGSVTAVRDADNSSLQLVEMCQNEEGVWSPLCDNEWTLQDATVVCRELGYTNLGKSGQN